MPQPDLATEPTASHTGSAVVSAHAGHRLLPQAQEQPPGKGGMIIVRVHQEPRTDMPVSFFGVGAWGVNEPSEPRHASCYLSAAVRRLRRASRYGSQRGLDANRAYIAASA